MNELLNSKLVTYVNNPRDAFANFDIGLEYMNQGQRASAISYLLRAAELTTDKHLAYTCIILNYKNLDSQVGRTHSAMGQLLHAIALCPDRPEAYYILSLFYEARQEWQECYTMACIAEKLSPGPVYTDLGYPGSYGPILQKAVSGWYLGYGTASRKLFKHLQLNYKMKPEHLQVVENNISRLGPGPASVAWTSYKKENHNKLKVNFPGSEHIEQNFSQVYQDMFVLSALNGKKEGIYLEVGSGDPFYGNNTALLEQNYNWTGRSIEYNQELVDKHNNSRKNPADCKDATTINYSSYIKTFTDSKIIDYLQLDCDPPNVTYDTLTKIPFDEYKFGVITYEHDYFVDLTQTFREKSRKLLKSKGYELVLGDAGPTDWYSFEDWWVHPDLVSADFIKDMKCVRGSATKAEDYMLGRILDKK